MSEPISPIDPTITGGQSPEGEEFLQSVYMDRDATRPLKVKKRVAGIGPASRRRRSMISVPSSPSSRHGVRTPRSPNPHHAISRIFLNMPQSPNPTLDSLPLSWKSRSSSSHSELHLGLGRFSAYDNLQPGPSPPHSPVPSPTKRAFDLGQKPLPPSPLTPMTPSRAPRKAAKLLGTVNQSKATKVLGVSTTPKKKEHYRPIPTATLVELERFFGNVPKKPSSRTLKSARSTPKLSQHGSHGTKGSERNVGEGKTTVHRGEDGSMWLDVEEEQEFAWLMSEIVNMPPVAHAETVDVISESDEDHWGMKTFTNVLSMSKPKQRREDNIKYLEPSKLMPTPPRHVDSKSDPWMISSTGSTPELSPSTPPRLVAPPVNPFATPSPSRVLDCSPPQTGPSPAYLFPSSSDRRSPSPKERHRPPPLALKPAKPNPRLPILVPDSPPARPRRDISPPMPRGPPRPSGNQTPFIHPRQAPRPQADFVPSLPIATRAAAPFHDDEEPTSFFEPVTPVESRTFGRPPANTKGKSGGGWLKKVVKDLGGVKL